MNIALVEANDDEVTKPVHEARKLALAPIENRGHRIEKLFGVNATKQALAMSWAAIPGFFGLISGLGHGSNSTFTGYLQIDVLTTSDSPAISGAIVHLFSCNCGNKLGAHLVAVGAKAFIGYTDFVAVPNNTTLTHHFVREAAAIDIGIAAGKSAISVKTEADAAFRSARADLLASPDATATEVAELENNHNSLVGPWTNSAKWGSF